MWTMYIYRVRPYPAPGATTTPAGGGPPRGEPAGPRGRRRRRRGSARRDRTRHLRDARPRHPAGGQPERALQPRAGREDLLAAVAERRLAAFELPPAAEPWTEWLRAVGLALHRWLGLRPMLTGVVLAHVGGTRAGPELLRTVLDRLEAAGVDRATGHLAWHAVLTVVLGSVQQEHTRGRPDDSFPAVLDLVVGAVAASAEDSPGAAARDLLRRHPLGS